MILDTLISLINRPPPFSRRRTPKDLVHFYLYRILSGPMGRCDPQATWLLARIKCYQPHLWDYIYSTNSLEKFGCVSFFTTCPNIVYYRSMTPLYWCKWDPPSSDLKHSNGTSASEKMNLSFEKSHWLSKSNFLKKNWSLRTLLGLPPWTPIAVAIFNAGKDSGSLRN